MNLFTQKTSNARIGTYELQFVHYNLVLPAVEDKEEYTALIGGFFVSKITIVNITTKEHYRCMNEHFELNPEKHLMTPEERTALDRTLGDLGLFWANTDTISCTEHPEDDRWLGYD